MDIYTRFKKQTIIIAGVILLLIFLTIIYSGIKRMDTQKEVQPNNMFIPYEKTGAKSISPSEERITGNPQQVLLETIAKRPLLSPEDIAAKKKMVALIPAGEESGVIIESDTVRIEYIHTPDIFQVEILTTDIPQAKKNANALFRKFGMSQKGVCYLPVQFYLNYEVSRQLGEQKKSFSPLPLGC